MFPRALYPLAFAEIEETAAAFKDDLTRECERCVRRNDTTGALAAIYGKEYIDKFVNALKVHAGSMMCQGAKTARELAAVPPKARAIRLPGASTLPLLKPPVRVKLTKREQREQAYAREVAAASRCMGHPKHY